MKVSESTFDIINALKSPVRSELNQILTPQEYFISHIECAECAWIAQRAGDANWF